MTESRRLDDPQPGYWMMRLVGGGVEVPACIERHHTVFEPDHPTNLMDRPTFLTARIGQDYVPLSAVWEKRGRPITRKEYLYQLKLAHWARHYAPDDPRATPRERVPENYLRDRPAILPPKQK